MCSMSVMCPLCTVPSFGSIDALQQRLIKAANGPLACPFPQCSELFLGLDKLTIHLFTHTSLMTMTDSKAKSTDAQQQAEVITAASSTTTKRKAKKPKPSKISQNDTLPLSPSLPSPSATGGNSSPPTGATTSASVSCDICENNFSSTELRDMHFRLVHENVSEISATSTVVIEPYKCHLCAKTFKMKGSLRVHLKVVHMLGLPYVNNTLKLNICDRIRHKEEGNTCSSIGPMIANNNCSSNNASTSNASTQPYAISGARGMLTNDTVQLSTSNTELSSSATGDGNPKIWECDVCAKCFTTKYFLKKHKRLHTGEMPYTCQICARTFTFQQSYHKHLLYHSEIKPHVCSACGRAFKELSTLHNHERIHSGEKPFKCEVCGKCFRQRVSFLVHTRIHTGVMPYKCELCDKSFRYKVSQRTHKCAPLPPPPSDVAAEDAHTQSPEQFIKAFLECNGNAEAQHSPASAEISAINGADQTEALLVQTIDDIVVESCQKMGICGQPEVVTAQPSPTPSLGVYTYRDNDSPLQQQLRHLRLYSPQLVNGEDVPSHYWGVDQQQQQSE